MRRQFFEFIKIIKAYDCKVGALVATTLRIFMVAINTKTGAIKKGNAGCKVQRNDNKNYYLFIQICITYYFLIINFVYT